MIRTPGRRRVRGKGNLELFFDLVFAFAMWQVQAVATAGGMPLFYLGDVVAYRWRDRRQPHRPGRCQERRRHVPAGLLHIPGVAALGVLTGIGWVRLAWELWRRPRIGPAVAGQVR